MSIVPLQSQKGSVASQQDDIDVAEWKRSRLHDEVVQMSSSQTGLAASGGSAHHSGTAATQMNGSGSRASNSGISKVHYITPNASGAAVTTIYTSPESGAVLQPSSTVMVTYPPGQCPPLMSPQQNVTYIVVDNGGSSPMSTVVPQSSHVMAPGVSIGGDYSTNRLSTTGMAGSASVMAVGGSLNVNGGTISPGGSGSHQPTAHVSHANVRTITIHPSSSHFSDPSSSSGPGSTNDFFPVLINQSDHASADIGGHSGTTDASSLGRQQAYFMAHQQLGGPVGVQPHHAVLLPDGSLVAPHTAMSVPQRIYNQPNSSIIPQQMQMHMQAQHTTQGMLLQHQHQPQVQTEDAMLSRSLGSSTTTNAAVWGGSASAGLPFGVNSSTMGATQQHQLMGGAGAVVGAPPAPISSAATSLQRPLQQQAPRSQFIGGRGRGGAVVQGPPAAAVHLQNAGMTASSPQPMTGPLVRGRGGPPLSTGLGFRGAGPGPGRGGGVVVGRQPVNQPPLAPTLGASPSILIGKLPTPQFAQSITVGGMRLGTTNLVAPRVPGQGEEVLSIKVGQQPTQ